MLGIYLNVPNTTIVNIANAVSDDGYSDVSDRTRIDTTQKILLTWKDSWKDMHPKIKEREKVKEPACAVTEMVKSEMASVITEKTWRKRRTDGRRFWREQNDQEYRLILKDHNIPL